MRQLRSIVQPRVKGVKNASNESDSQKQSEKQSKENEKPPNTRLYLSPRAFNRFAVTREINDGLLAPRFAPSQRAYVLSGTLTLVDPAVPASVPRDDDDR